jgi:hypothetical protein
LSRAWARSRRNDETPHDRHVETRRGEVTGVQLDDAAPFAGEVGLGDDAERGRAALQDPAQERYLRCGQLLGRVGDEQRRRRAGQRAEGQVALRGGQAADTRGVDEGQAGAEQSPVQADLHAPGGRRGRGDMLPDLVERHADGVHRAVGGGHPQGDRGLPAVPQHGGTAVPTSTSTGQMPVRRRALTSVLLPCLNHPPPRR